MLEKHPIFTFEGQKIAYAHPRAKRRLSAGSATPTGKAVLGGKATSETGLIGARLDPGVTLTFDATDLIGFATVLDGVGLVQVADAVISLQPMEGFFFGARSSYRCTARNTFAMTSFLMRREVFWRHVRTGYRDPKKLFTDRVLPASDPARRSLSELVMHFIRELDAETAAVFGEESQIAMEGALALRLFETLSASERAGGRGETPSDHRIKPRLVRTAEAYIDRHFSRIGKIDEVAHAAGVSGRTLTRSFQSFLGMSPAQYLRAKRLDVARSALSDGGDTRSIQEIAEDSGFSSYASFWRNYLRDFQETPSETRIRNTVGRASARQRAI